MLPLLSSFPKSRRIAPALLIATILLATACGEQRSAPSWLRQRQDDYLAHATATPMQPSSLLHVLNHLERARRDPRFSVAAGSIPADAWQPVFDKLYALKDTSDFDLLYLQNLVYAFDGHPAAPPALWAAARQAVLDFKYWYTDPTPARMVDGAPVVDQMWYWSENHVLLFRVNEFLAGQRHPDEVFTVTGWTGAQHRERARGEILRWIDERARFGFTEWHSDVYYQKDLTPLLSLIEWADDGQLVRRATMLLDLLLVDYALKMHHGNFGGTHGRSYVKDKVSATKQDAFNGCKLLFDDTELDYSSVSAPDASLLARSRRYRLPPVIRDIATHPMTMVDRQRMNVALDEKPTDNADDPLPDAPYGLDFDDEANLSFWWSMGSQTLWVNLRLLFEVAERENLWDAQLADYKVLRDLVWVDGDIEATLANAHAALKLIWPMANLALLNEVNTYTYRTPQYMLSTAQDYRKGLRGAQTHISQATLSEHAIVFTQHPAYLPVAAGDDVPPDWNWQKEDEPGPGYWTGDGANPRSAQHRNVAIHIYWPQYPSTPPLGFGYREETHAYFPHAHFDEVVQEGSWTFGRKNDAYVALYSWRATAWRSGQPEVFENAGMPFDLVAGGSARNVWIVECSSAPEWGSFAAFRAAFQTASVDVTENDASAPDGYDVQYVSPSQGIIRFGWHEPLVVNGLEIPIGDYPRFDNPFVQSDFDSQRYEIRTRRNALTLDFATGLRRIGGPRPLSRSFF